MLPCNIIPEFRAQCADMDPFPQRVPTSPRREASLLNLPETLSFRHFFVCYGSGVTMGSQAFEPNRRVLALSGEPGIHRFLRLTIARAPDCISMSAFGRKADVNHCVGECPLIAISGPWVVFRDTAIRHLDAGDGSRPPHQKRTCRT